MKFEAEPLEKVNYFTYASWFLVFTLFFFQTFLAREVRRKCQRWEEREREKRKKRFFFTLKEGFFAMNLKGLLSFLWLKGCFFFTFHMDVLAQISKNFLFNEQIHQTWLFPASGLVYFISTSSNYPSGSSRHLSFSLFHKHSRLIFYFPEKLFDCAFYKSYYHYFHHLLHSCYKRWRRVTQWRKHKKRDVKVKTWIRIV